MLPFFTESFNNTNNHTYVAQRVPATIIYVNVRVYGEWQSTVCEQRMRSIKWHFYNHGLVALTAKWNASSLKQLVDICSLESVHMFASQLLSSPVQDLSHHGLHQAWKVKALQLTIIYVPQLSSQPWGRKLAGGGGGWDNETLQHTFAARVQQPHTQSTPGQWYSPQYPILKHIAHSCGWDWPCAHSIQVASTDDHNSVIEAGRGQNCSLAPRWRQNIFTDP